jgi:hypothetical protein
MTTCTVCNATQNPCTVTTTTDGNTICLHCYHKATDYHHKGLVSTTDCKEALKALDEFGWVVDDYILAIRRLARLENKEPMTTYEEVMDREYLQSLSTYRCSPECLSIPQRCDLIRQLLKAEPFIEAHKVRIGQNNGTEGNYMRHVYMTKYDAWSKQAGNPQYWFDEEVVLEELTVPALYQNAQI